MLAFPGSVRIYVAVQPVDMRKSFNGLWAAVSEQLHEEPKSGAVFGFINKDRTRLKFPAHARRYFVEAMSEKPKAVQLVLRLIAQLYRLEAEWD